MEKRRPGLAAPQPAERLGLGGDRGPVGPDQQQLLLQLLREALLLGRCGLIGCVESRGVPRRLAFRGVADVCVRAAVLLGGDLQVRVGAATVGQGCWLAAPRVDAGNIAGGCWVVRGCGPRVGRWRLTSVGITRE